MAYNKTCNNCGKTYSKPDGYRGGRRRTVVGKPIRSNMVHDKCPRCGKDCIPHHKRNAEGKTVMVYQVIPGTNREFWNQLEQGKKPIRLSKESYEEVTGSEWSEFDVYHKIYEYGKDGYRINVECVEYKPEKKKKKKEDGKTGIFNVGAGFVGLGKEDDVRSNILGVFSDGLMLMKIKIFQITDYDNEDKYEYMIETHGKAKYKSEKLYKTQSGAEKAAGRYIKKIMKHLRKVVNVT